MSGKGFLAPGNGNGIGNPYRRQTGFSIKNCKNLCDSFEFSPISVTISVTKPANSPKFWSNFVTFYTTEFSPKFSPNFVTFSSPKFSPFSTIHQNFRQNLASAFRDDKEFTNMTLAIGDGHQGNIVFLKLLKCVNEDNKKAAFANLFELKNTNFD